MNFLHSINPGVVHEGKIDKTGWTINFVKPYEIQGKVKILREAWKHYNRVEEKEIGFDATRIKKIFSAMRKGDIVEIKLNDHSIIGRWKDLNLTWTYKSQYQNQSNEILVQVGSDIDNNIGRYTDLIYETPETVPIGDNVSITIYYIDLD